MIIKFKNFILEGKYLETYPKLKRESECEKLLVTENNNDYTIFDNDSGEGFWGNKGAGALIYCNSTKRFLLPFRSEYVNESETWGIWAER